MHSLWTSCPQKHRHMLALWAQKRVVMWSEHIPSWSSTTVIHNRRDQNTFLPFLSRTTPTSPPVLRKTVAVTPLAAVRSPASKRRVGSPFSRATTTSSVRCDLHPGADSCPGSIELTLGHRHLLLWPSLCFLKCECYGLSHQKDKGVTVGSLKSYLTQSIELLGW